MPLAAARITVAAVTLRLSRRVAARMRCTLCSRVAAAALLRRSRASFSHEARLRAKRPRARACTTTILAMSEAKERLAALPLDLD
eukprot:6179668-Pleurochrysis_carterae.AAC.3